MNTCERMRLMISRRMDDDLGEKEALVLAKHLSECVVCTAVARRMAREHESLRAARPEMSPALARIPVDLLTTHVSSVPASARRAPFAVPKFAIAASVIAAVGLTALLVSFPSRKTPSFAHSTAPSIAATDTTGYDEEPQADAPLAALCYYRSIDSTTAGSIGEGRIAVTPLSSYDVVADSAATRGYESPFFDEQPVRSTTAKSSS